MGDLIDRQAAINKINERQRKLIYCFGFENDVVKIMDLAKSIVSAMPSAQPDIIRCEDCRYGHAHNPDGTRICEYHDDMAKHDDDFCSRAERRDDG